MSNIKNNRNYDVISKKASSTKKSTIIDGMNMHQIGAIRAAATTAIKYTKEERGKQIRDGLNLYWDGVYSERKNNEQLLLNRYNKIISKIGVVRLITLMYKCKNRYKNITRKTFYCWIQHQFGQEIFDSFIKLINEEEYFYMVVKGFPYKIECPVCGTIKINTSSVPKRTCSRSCAHILHYKEHPEKRESAREKQKIIGADPAYKLKMSNSLKARYLKTTEEERKEWYNKLSSSMGNDGFLKRGAAIQATKIAKGLVIDQKDIPEYAAYKRNVLKFTKRNDITHLENSNLRGKHDYHLDHIYPIKQGFMNKIPAELIGDIRNLRMLYCVDNMQKTDNITEIPEFIGEYLNEYNKN